MISIAKGLQLEKQELFLKNMVFNQPYKFYSLLQHKFLLYLYDLSKLKCLSKYRWCPYEASEQPQILVHSICISAMQGIIQGPVYFSYGKAMRKNISWPPVEESWI